MTNQVLEEFVATTDYIMSMRNLVTDILRWVDKHHPGTSIAVTYDEEDDRYTIWGDKVIVHMNPRKEVRFHERTWYYTSYVDVKWDGVPDMNDIDPKLWLGDFSGVEENVA